MKFLAAFHGREDRHNPLYRKSRLVYVSPFRGEVTERPKVHDWKSCVLKGTEGSNPSLSAISSLCHTFRN